eukprot:2651609-Pyramimonas_sp.AAC.1
MSALPPFLPRGAPLVGQRGRRAEGDPEAYGTPSIERVRQEGACAEGRSWARAMVAGDAAAQRGTATHLRGLSEWSARRAAASKAS